MDQTFYKNCLSLMFPLCSESDAGVCGSGGYNHARSVEQNSMAAVSLATQIQFIQNMFLGAIVASVAILGAQYWGKGPRIH